MSWSPPREYYCDWLMIGMIVIRTATTESRAATARMSAHDTVRGHSASSRALMVSMTPNPLSDPAFGPALFSPVKLPVSSSRTDASQPWRTHIHRQQVYTQLVTRLVHKESYTSTARLLWIDLPARSSRGSEAGAGRRPCAGPAPEQPARRS